MPFDSDFFGGFEDLFSSQENLFSTDIKTILGKNVILNYLCKIEFEIRSFGYSPSANEIAKFYEECKKKGGIIQFFSNPVIKNILQEIQSMPTVKLYLKRRIFDDIEDDKIKVLENTLKNNDKLTDKLNKDINEFSKQKELRRKKINKIMKQNDCTFEEAEKRYEQKLLLEQQKKLKQELDQEFMNLLLPSSNISDTKTKILPDEGTSFADYIYKTNKNLYEQLKKDGTIQEENNTEITLDDNFNDNNIDNDSYWN